MFLATTAIQEFWDVSQPILFLGEWCKLHGEKQDWSHLHYEVLPYHWDDRNKLYADFLKSGDYYEKCLQLISNKLNDVHGVDHSVQYWRIIVGPWLRYFIDMLYDRYLSIVDAAKFDDEVNTWILSKPLQLIPNDISDFKDLFCSDDYNLGLYSQVIESTGIIPYELRSLSHGLREQRSESRIKERARALVRDAIAKAINCIPSRFGELVFVTSYFDTLSLARLRLSLGQFPFYLDPKLKRIELETDLGLRERMCSEYGSDDFERLLNKLTFLNIPRVYLEGYHILSRDSTMVFPKNPKVISTANAYESNEMFKFWAAGEVERGARLVICQHGGHYGTGLFSGTEDHEVKIASKYITWGWGWKENSNIVPLPAQKLVSIDKRRNERNPKYIFWNLNGAPRYSYRLYSIPIGPQWAAYFRMQVEFAKRINSGVKKALLCRPYMKDFGWDVIGRIREEVCDIQFDPNPGIWQDRLDSARLAIETVNMTTFLESMAADIPTIVLLQPEHWEIREAAQPVFDALKEVGIYHTDVESAAEKVNQVYNDPQLWWRRKDVQEVRKEFCSCFARTSDGWLAEWKTQFTKLLNDQEPLG